MDPKTLWPPGSHHVWIWYYVWQACIAIQSTSVQVDYIQTWFGENQIFRKSDTYSVAIPLTLDFDYGVTLADGLLLHQQDGDTSQNQLAKPGFMIGIATL